MKSQVVISTGRIFETIYYFIITSYPLSIEKRFLYNQFVSSTNDTDFAWYSKYGGGDSGLKFIFHFKDYRGHISNPSLTPLDMNTELVYADGYATLLIPLSPVKENKSSQARKNPFYRLVDSYCIISSNFYFIMSGIVFIFV